VRGPHVEKRSWTYQGQRRTSAFYYLVFYVKAGPLAKRVYRRTDPPTDQKRLALEQLHRALAAGITELPAGNLTVAQILTAYGAYWKAQHLSTWQDKRYWLEWWRAEYGHLRARAFRPSHVDAAIVRLEERGLARGTIGDHLSILRAAFRRAVKEGSLDAHPACSLEAWRYQSPERHVTWTEAEFKALSAELPGWAARLFALLLTTGLRVGDALRLRWSDLGGDRIEIEQEKTRAPLVLPLTRAARGVLDQIPKRGEYVFQGPGKRPYAYRTLSRALAEAREESGITGKTIHDLRRTFATRLLNAHVSPALIAALLGQRTTRLVSRYTHAEMETLRAAAEAPQLAAVRSAVAGSRTVTRKHIRSRRKGRAS
jgi:integrase